MSFLKPSEASRFKKFNKYSEKLFLRPKEVKPVAAWVLPDSDYTVQIDAETSAIEVEKKLREIQVGKEIKLKHFRNEVRQRLALAAKSEQDDKLEKFLRNAREKYRVVSKDYYQTSRGIVEDVEDILGGRYDKTPYAEHLERLKRSSEYKELSRRAFMDAERKQVKENVRSQMIKKKLEEERKIRELEEIFKISNVRVSKSPSVEDESFAVDQECGGSDGSKSEASSIDRKYVVHKHFDRTQQARFIATLKEGLNKKFISSNQSLPQLCFCSPNFLETNPTTCANNCIFYRNPAAYIRALENLAGS